MKCPFLKGSCTHRLCGASPTLYTPVMEDHEVYCSTEGFAGCPIYLSHTRIWNYTEGRAIGAV